MNSDSNQEKVENLSSNCQLCDSQAEKDDYPVSLCITHRNQLARLPFPLWIKAVSIGLLLLIAIALSRLPRALEVGIHYEKGNQAEEEKRYYDVIEEFEQVLQVFPKATGVQARLAIAYYKTRDREKFVELVQQLENKSLPTSLTIQLNYYIDELKPRRMNLEELDQRIKELEDKIGIETIMKPKTP